MFCCVGFVGKGTFVQTATKSGTDTNPKGVDTRPRSEGRSLVPLQKQVRENRYYVWTKALSDKVFLPAQELSGLVYTKPERRSCAEDTKEMYQKAPLGTHIVLFNFQGSTSWLLCKHQRNYKD